MQINHFDWCLPLSFVLLLIPLVLSIRWFHDEEHSGRKLTAITLLVIASVTVLRLPLRLYWQESPSVGVVHSVIDALQTIGMGANLEEIIKKGAEVIDGVTVEQISKISEEGKIYAIYATIQYALGLLMCGLAAVKALSGGLRRWWTRWFRLGPVFFFSHMTEESLVLARSIQEEMKSQRKNALICFASANDKMDSALTWQSAGLKRVVCFSESLNAGILPLMASCINCILCSGDEAVNLQLLYELLEEKKRRKSTRKYFVVAHSRTAERTVDQLINTYICEQHREDIICLIDPAENLAVNILNQVPLHQYAAEAEGGRKRLNILIGGSTALAGRFLMNAYACGQMVNCDLSITLADPDAERFQAELYCSAPMLKQTEAPVVRECGQLHFVPLRIPAQIADEELVKDAHYILLAYEDDTENIQAARRIRRIIERQKLQDAARGSEKVAIAYVVQNPALHKISAVTDTTHKETLYTPCDMMPVGSREEQLSADMFFCHDALIKGFFQDCVYSTGLPSVESEEDIRQLQKRFAEFQCGMRNGQYAANADKRSSVAASLCLSYRHGFLKDHPPQDDPIWDLLADAEHRRWNAYMIISGFMTPTEEQWKAYAYKGGHTHKNQHAYLHPCMVTSRPGHPANLWDSMDELDEYDQFTRQNHQLLVERLEALLAEHDLSCPLLRSGRADLKDLIDEAVEAIPDAQQRSEAHALAGRLFSEYKVYDRNMIFHTNDILRLAEDERVSAALRLFWLEVK